MDVYQNVAVDGGLPLEFQTEKKVPSSSGSSPSISKLEEFFPGENQEADDFSVQWLSIFVEDCLSSRTNYTSITNATTNTPHKPHQPPKPQNLTLQFETPSIPSKSRTKRRKLTPNTTLHGIPTEPPLLHDHHAFWLADSELIVPKKTIEETSATPSPKQVVSEYEEVEEEEKVAVQPRRCTHCLSHRTPQWRAGPLGPKTLCNACGVRFKSGRLLPEYRPAKSPTFVSYKHSNSHKKVMEMRMAIKVSSHSK